MIEATKIDPTTTAKSHAMRYPKGTNPIEIFNQTNVTSHKMNHTTSTIQTRGDYCPNLT